QCSQKSPSPDWSVPFAVTTGPWAVKPTAEGVWSPLQLPPGIVNWVVASLYSCTNPPTRVGLPAPPVAPALSDGVFGELPSVAAAGPADEALPGAASGEPESAGEPAVVGVTGAAAVAGAEADDAGEPAPEVRLSAPTPPPAATTTTAAAAATHGQRFRRR